MKPSLILFAAATLAPTMILAGLGTTAAFSLATIVAVSAMMVQDYGPKLSYRREFAKVSAVKRLEAHPLAA
jgi:mevalonate kinase